MLKNNLYNLKKTYPLRQTLPPSFLKSNSEYLVRNPIQAALRSYSTLNFFLIYFLALQDLKTQGLQELILNNFKVHFWLTYWWMLQEFYEIFILFMKKQREVNFFYWVGYSHFVSNVWCKWSKGKKVWFRRFELKSENKK